MRKFLRFLNVAVLAVTAGFLTTGCEKDSTPGETEVASLTAELVSASSTSADIKVTTTKITEVAYVVAAENETAPEPAVIFATGTRGVECTDGENTLTVRNLDPLTNYVIYLAGITDEEDYYEEVAAVQVSTTDFAEDVATYDVDCDNFKVRIRVPDGLAESGNVLKWGLCDIIMYNMNKQQGASDAEMMNLNDDYYHNYFNEDKVFSFSNNEEDMYVHDENGDVALDEGGNKISYYEPIVPGGKYVVMFGEYSWGDYMYGGWEQGYYVPLFDLEKYYEDQWTGLEPNEDEYWTGYHQNVEVQLNAPEKLDASFNIETNLRPNGGVISFTPDENIEIYCYTLLDRTTYDMIMSMYLNNDPDNLQWFLTTTLAMYTCSVYSATEPVDLVIEDWFYTVDRSMEYIVLAVGMGDQLGHSQCFEEMTFTLPDPTEPAPELEINAIANPNGEESPYEIWFNVKCPSGDASEGIYACNYEREWESSLKSGYDNETLIESGYEFSAEEIGEINSDAGLNVSFSSREDAVTYLGAILYNDEGTASEAVVAKGKTIAEPAADPVSSTLFDDLLGDWTAKATVEYQAYNYDTWNYETVTEELTSKVTIGDVGYEETLPDEVYDTFFQYSNYTTKEEVDAVYNEFKAAVDVFNEKARNQNRLLCQGLGLLIKNYEIDYCAYASPYDLFISEDYNGYDSESPVFDFGPKWYLQIAADGSVSVPFNMNLMAPLTAWQAYGSYYLVGASADATLPYISDGTSAQNGYFPATVSEDKNSITINALEYQDDTYYPNIASYSYGYFQLRSRIISPIELTRGWSGDDSSLLAASQYAKARKIADPASLKELYKVNPLVKAKSRTAMPTKAPVVRKQVKGHVVTTDEFNANIKKYYEKRYGKR